MYSFEGDFREKPKQSLGGNKAKLQRDEFIQKTAEERRKREDNRRRIRAATIIQSTFRKHVIRKRLFEHLRQNFDERFSYLNEKDFDVNEIAQLLRNLLVFYCRGVDDFRLTSFGQLIITKKDIVLQCLVKDVKQWLHRIKKLLHLNMRHLSNSQSTNISIPLRLLEIYTTSSTYVNISDGDKTVLSIWLYLIDNGYFLDTRKILDCKVPPPYEETLKPPTPLAASILDLILRPLNICAKVDPLVVLKFFTDFLAPPLSLQIRHYILPTIINDLPMHLNGAFVLTALANINLNNSTNVTQLKLKPNLWLFYSFMKIMSPQFSKLEMTEKVKYVVFLKEMSFTLPENSQESAMEEEEEDKDAMITDEMDDSAEIVSDLIGIINDASHVNLLMTLFEEDSSNVVLLPLTHLCHSMTALHRLAVYKYRLLYTLSFKSVFLRKLWNYITTVETRSVFGSPTPLIQILSRGQPLAAVDWHKMLPQLTLFCSLFSYLLPTLDDVEFYESTKTVTKFSPMPFTLQELQGMTLVLKDVCIGLVELAYHDTKLAFIDEYKNVIKNTNGESSGAVKDWLKLFKTSVYLLRQLYRRDSRRKFCPENHWISKQVVISVERPTNFRVGNRQRQRYQQFVGLRHLTREELEEEGPPLSTTEIRNITILQEIPFVVPFHDRVKILQALMFRDKEQTIGNLHQFQVPGSSIAVQIRRSYIYEDAFDKLSLDNEPDLKRPIRVQLVNAVGLDEAGIDGGGIFREFLNELLKTAFDPNRGFFRSTDDSLLYPNATAELIVENYEKHYFFMGRMLGKALYENLLVELPFSTFFLAKILAKHSGSDIDIHHLASLDPVMYKNLVYLKNYEGDVSDLGLDFTVMISDFGENKVVELKPGGSKIPVTAQNRIEYIHLVADYRLNKQIRTQCMAFKQGLANVIDLDWIRMFDPRELQILISGAPTPIDIDDLKKYSNYSGGYSADHKTITAFWNVVTHFSEQQKRRLLKFVTSCSRPPLLGFRDLHPPFCIQSAGREDRLPTASTCMNLLKLPEYSDTDILQHRLLCAIESGVGFELS